MFVGFVSHSLGFDAKGLTAETAEIAEVARIAEVNHMENPLAVPPTTLPAPLSHGGFSAPRRVSARWMQGLIESLAQSGLDMDALCADIGLDMPALIAKKQGCPTEKVSQLWVLAEARSGNPAIGLAAPHTARPAGFEVVGYVMMSSVNLAEGLTRFVRYLRILGDTHSAVLREEGANCRLTLEIFGGRLPIPRQRYEATLLTFLTFCRWITGPALRPMEVTLTQAAPAHVQPYKDAFMCPLHFGAHSNSVLFSGVDLALLLPTSNPLLAAMMEQCAIDQLKQLGGAEVSHRVRDLIVRKLPDGEPGRADIARQLSVSERTLQRQLQREGASFQELLDTTRQELAERYLRQDQVSLAEASYMLGFAEQSNFTRACKRWFNLSPGQYRAKLAIEALVDGGELG